MQVFLFSGYLDLVVPFCYFLVHVKNGKLELPFVDERVFTNKLEGDIQGITVNF